MGQRTQRDEKKGGGREWLKESFRCRCDPAAEYFNITAIRGGQAPFGHPPCITCEGPFCVQCKAEITLPSLQMLLVQLDQQMPQRKRTAGSYKQGYFSLPYPLATGNQRCSIMLRHNLPCQTPGSLGVLWFWSLVLTLRVTSCALPRVSLDVCTVQSSHQVTTSFPNKKLYRIVPPEMQPSPY